MTDVLALDSLGSARRREILRLVWRTERPAGEIHQALGDVTFGAVSQQLTALRAAGLVTARRSGRYVLYTRTAVAEAFLTAADT